jgi:hypothetical protein
VGAVSVRVEHGDCLDIIPQLVEAEGVRVDAIVTDPPYHLHSQNLSVDWAAMELGRLTNKAGRGGFMGQLWDGGDIAFRPETWATVATIMRPGAFIVAFGGTRTYQLPRQLLRGRRRAAPPLPGRPAIAGRLHPIRPTCVGAPGRRRQPARGTTRRSLPPRRAAGGSREAR